MASVERRYLPSLEGIRAYAFLLVFAVHFSGTSWSLTNRSVAAYPWLLTQQLSFVALPIFFALSGYLITGILFDTRGKQGFFRVFYLRRALRVFPLYYFTLFALSAFLVLRGVHLPRRDALFLVYLHNLWPSISIYQLSPKVYIGHFWSLAVEEQFYFLWPFVIWLLPDRRKLLTFCYVAVSVAFLGRLWAVHAHVDPGTAYENTLFRSDAIMLGAALALHERGPMRHLHRLSKPAAFVAIGGATCLILRALAVGQALPYDTFGVMVVVPLLALMGAAIVVLAINPGNVVHLASTQPWAVNLGKFSYALYVLHQLLAPLFLNVVIPRMSRVCGALPGQIIGMLVAFLLVYTLSRLSFHFIEQPAMRYKSRFRYGTRLAATSRPLRYLPNSWSGHASP